MKRVLLIDDDITSLDIISYLFERKGFEVHRCSSGVSALDVVKEVDADLLIVDLMMPELNGVETVRQIRDMGLTDVPVIAFTAVSDEQMHEEALEAGCNKVLTKPCSSERLMREVDDILGTET